MELFAQGCPCCGNRDVYRHTSYMTKNHGERTIQHCRACDSYLSETYATPMAGLRTPLSRVIEVLSARTEGMGLNATAGTYHVAKKSIIAWEWQLAALKPRLRLYSLMHRFIDLQYFGQFWKRDARRASLQKLLESESKIKKKAIFRLSSKNTRT